jgi:S-adenosylmethionine hydrolase
VITNLRLGDLAGCFRIQIGNADIRRVVDSYDEGEQGEVFAIEGSTGFIELSLKQGSAAEKLGIRRGQEIEVETDASNQ